METKVVPIKNVKMDWFLPVDLKDASSVQIASHHCVMYHGMEFAFSDGAEAFGSGLNVPWECIADR